MFIKSKYLIIGVILGLFFNNISYAYRSGKPVKITVLNENALKAINNNFEEIWNITNGRFNLNVVISNPDGNTSGKIGDVLLFNNSGTYYFCINTTGAKIWRNVLLQDIP